MNIIYVVLMTMHVDYGNTYRLNRLLPFFLMTYGLNVQLFTLPKTIFVKIISFEGKNHLIFFC